MNKFLILVVLIAVIKFSFEEGFLKREETIRNLQAPEGCGTESNPCIEQEEFELDVKAGEDQKAIGFEFVSKKILKFQITTSATTEQDEEDPSIIPEGVKIYYDLAITSSDTNHLNLKAHCKYDENAREILFKVPVTNECVIENSEGIEIAATEILKIQQGTQNIEFDMPDIYNYDDTQVHVLVKMKTTLKFENDIIIKSATDAGGNLPKCSLGFKEENCISCNPEFPNKCSCKENEYYHAANSSCLNQPSSPSESCGTWNKNDDTKCEVCATGYFKKNGICTKKCTTGENEKCKVCQTTDQTKLDLCNDCNEGYELLDDNKTCKKEEDPNTDSSSLLKFGKVLLLLFFVLA